MSTKLVDRGVLRRGVIVAAIASAFALIVVARLPICPMAGVLGIPCPGCGLTRATLALLHGDVQRALGFHPLAPVIAPVFIAAVVSAALGYVRPRRSPNLNPWLASPIATVLAAALLIATLGVWGARFLGYFGGPAPVETFRDWMHTRLR